MDKIEIQVLNPDVLIDARKMMACGARLTQSGEKIKNLWELEVLYNKPATDKFISSLCKLPHATLQRFVTINVAVVGASRRFLAQITRHQAGVCFMSASLQYSNYGDDADFVIPYGLHVKNYGDALLQETYLDTCKKSMKMYKNLVDGGFSNDDAGYMAPQGLRNVLLISANPYEWKHMISQRVCRRNTPETRYVMLKIWEALFALDPVIFAPEITGPFCMTGGCQEGRMSCGNALRKFLTPTDILHIDFPRFYREGPRNEDSSN